MTEANIQMHDLTNASALLRALGSGVSEQPCRRNILLTVLCMPEEWQYLASPML